MVFAADLTQLEVSKVEPTSHSVTATSPVSPLLHLILLYILTTERRGLCLPLSIYFLWRLKIIIDNLAIL